MNHAVYESAWDVSAVAISSRTCNDCPTGGLACILSSTCAGYFRYLRPDRQYGTTRRSSYDFFVKHMHGSTQLESDLATLLVGVRPWGSYMEDYCIPLQASALAAVTISYRGHSPAYYSETPYLYITGTSDISCLAL